MFIILFLGRYSIIGNIHPPLRFRQSLGIVTLLTCVYVLLRSRMSSLIVMLLWLLLLVVVVIVERTGVEVGFLAVDHGIEPVVLVRRILHRPDGAVRFHQRVEPGHHVTRPRLVLAFHVTRVRIVHVVVERIVHRLVVVHVMVLAMVLVMVLVMVLHLWAMVVQLRRRRLWPVWVTVAVVVRRFVDVERLGGLLVFAKVRQTLRPRDHTQQNVRL